ncbi:helix-turn-helix transcriptional regulator [Streptomyces sp. NPDC057307]|uniref:helix-turn-helix transcriptional regulator n=1 Tax=Streptomyces sp. NPDC057307 TaxID=3346096 RepID=UPI003631B8A9
METHADLGEFLRSRRALLRPEDAGLPTYGGSRRRVPGLRREELAQLAGVSAGYYTRLEQGQSPNASDSVLDAVARVLRLDDDERAHLYSLARPRPKAPRREAEPERVRPGVRIMIRSFGDVPALVLGRFGDILDWNPAAHALLVGHLDIGSPDRPGDRPNIARLLFLDPHMRELYGGGEGNGGNGSSGSGWTRKARATVADLRLIAGRYPDDPGLTGLVGELTVASAEFAELWAAHSVGDCGTDTRTYRHPTVGAMTLMVEFMTLPNDEGQRVAVYGAEPGSASEAALRLLAATAAAPSSVT